MASDLSELALESLANLDCVVVRATERRDRAIDRLPIELATLQGKALLVHTGLGRALAHRSLFRRASLPDRRSRASNSSEAGVTLVGIDSFNIDCTDDGTRPVHSALLGAGHSDRRASLRSGRAARSRRALLRRARQGQREWAPSRCAPSPAFSLLVLLLVLVLVLEFLIPANDRSRAGARARLRCGSRQLRNPLLRQPKHRPLRHRFRAELA